MSHPLVRLEGVSRRFGSVVALDGARLEVATGQIHGILGENGAGKSTLLGVLGGLVTPDSGEVVLEGRRVTIATPRDAWELGIGLVHQHFKLVPRLTVLENVALGRASRRGWSLPLEEIAEATAELMDRTGLRVPLDRRIEDVSVGDRQRVEILKALLRNPRLLVLDEPTAVLAPEEIDSLFDVLRALAERGTSVAVVAHKLDEVLSVADFVTVLRKGRTVLEASRSEVDAPALARAMIGSDTVPQSLESRETGQARSAGEVVASLASVTVGSATAPALSIESLELRRGEVVGVAGVEGNGQQELARVLAGRLRPGTGKATLPASIGFIPQDRTTEGLVGDFDLTENVALALHRDAGFVSGAVIAWGRVTARTEELLRRFDVRAESAAVPAGTLSGGNQQKLIVARELEMAADLLVAENPTRGLDIAATVFVHESLARLIESGPDTAPAVVLISTDLDEVLALSDRVYVLVRGRLVEIPEASRTREGVGAAMLSGVSP